MSEWVSERRPIEPGFSSSSLFSPFLLRLAAIPKLFHPPKKERFEFQLQRDIWVNSTVWPVEFHPSPLYINYKLFCFSAPRWNVRAEMLTGFHQSIKFGIDHHCNYPRRTSSITPVKVKIIELINLWAVSLRAITNQLIPIYELQLSTNL